ncbi:monovalent cation/H+ antiporter complex subunit F [Natranaerobius thermophilus]|uniref:Multiple resistance and pH regulation protein F n=1 Tax=Natranaerobius thermophilus (strain ATCC BAA-1301 / DSM 18059 / JW/NM-WN-LF) TaxID=457570 RepID=B2A687_NATTJ|nr:monovalent cation/H+ antiporter complex subunit F [Natranaerobius thermophilus]ACB84098.1 multiple resistance and pH regulation protein F [Natranaerobius thermophilus JW/NM-WN-LF]
MVGNFFMYTAIALAILIMVSLYRAYVGPACFDRVVAINIISTKVVTIIALVSYIYQQEFFLDVALVYALISYVTVVGIAKYVEHGSC